MDSSSSSSSSASPNNNNNNHHASTTKTNGFLIHPKLGFETARSRSRLAMASPSNTSEPKVVTGTAGYILEDVPHFTDYIPNLPTYPNPLQDNPAYSVVKQYFVHVHDNVPQKGQWL